MWLGTRPDYVATCPTMWHHFLSVMCPTMWRTDPFFVCDVPDYVAHRLYNIKLPVVLVAKPGPFETSHIILTVKNRVRSLFGPQDVPG